MTVSMFAVLMSTVWIANAVSRATQIVFAVIWLVFSVVVFVIERL